MQLYLAKLVDITAQILIYAIFVKVLLSWTQIDRHGGLYRFFDEATRPIIRLAEKITPPTGMVNFAPLVAGIGIEVIRNLIIHVILN